MLPFKTQKAACCFLCPVWKQRHVSGRHIVTRVYMSVFGVKLPLEFTPQIQMLGTQTGTRANFDVFDQDSEALFCLFCSCAKVKDKKVKFCEGQSFIVHITRTSITVFRAFRLLKQMDRFFFRNPTNSNNWLIWHLSLCHTNYLKKVWWIFWVSEMDNFCWSLANYNLQFIQQEASEPGPYGAKAVGARDPIRGVVGYLNSLPSS